MKTRIELSCTEEDLITSLYEVHKIVTTLEIASASLKVFHDKNRNADFGHSWITVSAKNNPPDLFEIHMLKRKIAELRKSENQ